MKISYFILLLFLIHGCVQPDTASNNAPVESEATLPEKIESPAIQEILDSAALNGSILIFDPQKNIYYSNDFSWAKKGHLPASTFKIPNSIIFLESGTIENDSILIEWDGKKRHFKMWERDFIFRDAFKYSCLPCYQDITRKVGYKKMKKHVADLNYGNITFDSTDYDAFWVQGKSTINQFQQIDFLQRFLKKQLPISERTYQLMRDILIMDEKPAYKLNGKTGWSFSEGQNDNGWFVGYIEKGKQVYYFATNIEPKENFNMGSFVRIRTEITTTALEKLNMT